MKLIQFRNYSIGRPYDGRLHYLELETTMASGTNQKFIWSCRDISLITFNKDSKELGIILHGGIELMLFGATEDTFDLVYASYNIGKTIYAGSSGTPR